MKEITIRKTEHDDEGKDEFQLIDKTETIDEAIGMLELAQQSIMRKNMSERLSDSDD